MKNNIMKFCFTLLTFAGLSFSMANALPSVSYIDENGQVMNITEYTLIDQDQSGSQPLSGVHVVGADYNGDGKIDAADALVAGKSTKFTFLQGASVGSTGKDSAKIILADGFTLYMQSSLNVYYDSSFSVYGQENGTGKMDIVGPQGVGGINGYRGVDCRLNIYGGIISTLGGNGKTNGDGVPGIDRFGIVQINGGVIYSVGGGGGNIFPGGGKKDPGPAISNVTSFVVSNPNLRISCGNNTNEMTNVVFTAGDNVASRIIGRYVIIDRKPVEQRILTVLTVDSEGKLEEDGIIPINRMIASESVTNGGARVYADQYANQAPDYSTVSNKAMTAIQSHQSLAGYIPRAETGVVIKVATDYADANKVQKLVDVSYDFENGSNFTKRVYEVLTNVINRMGGSIINPPVFED